jgi:hypothetical protein
MNAAAASQLRVRLAGDATGGLQRSGSVPKSSPRASSALSTNSILAGVHDVLKHESTVQPGLMGSSVRGFDEIFRRLLPFVTAWRRSGGGDGGGVDGALPALYFVCADVQSCFDTIDQVSVCAHGGQVCH